MTDRAAGRSTQSLKIRMFGAFELTVNGRALKTRTPKDLHVLAFLLTHHDAEVDRDHLAALFWNIGRDGTPIGASDRLLLLSRCLSELGAALGEERARLQKPGGRTLRFVTEGAGIDLATFDMALAKGDAASLEKAAGLYRGGSLLDGWDEPWVVEARAEIEERYLDHLSRAAHRARLANDPAAAERRLRLALAIDPWREPLLRELLELQTEMRRFDAVRRQVETFCRLAEQEGREPEPETEQCFRRLIEEAEQFETSPRAGRIPSPLSSFVPREEEIAEVQALLYGSVRVPEDESKATDTPVLQHSRPRLLTLTGSGGVGKSRLAIEVARRVREDYYDRAWFVDLSALSDGSLVARTVASVLGLREEASRSIEESLTEFLRPKRLLLVLDNCEHLVHSCARLAADLLSACPHLCILATSREKLGLAGE